jgi:hypothetical protein
MTDAQRDQLDSVLLICAEVERHANAIDPSDPTAASVLVELNLDLVTGLRLLCKVVREFSHTHAPGPAMVVINGKAMLASDVTR